MLKYFLYISLSLLFFTMSFAKNLNIQEDIELGFVCELEKKILKKPYDLFDPSKVRLVSSLTC